MSKSPDVDDYGLTEQEWIAAQGGRPTVTTRGKLNVITHDYPGGDGMEVASHIPLENRGSTFIEIAGKLLMFPVGLLRRFHGEPCENKGNGKYPRSSR